MKRKTMHILSSTSVQPDQNNGWFFEENSPKILESIIVLLEKKSAACLKLLCGYVDAKIQKGVEVLE